ncbi:hypothetical protein ABTK71_19965, partial [Acinetobacter baumannii]
FLGRRPDSIPTFKQIPKPLPSEAWPVAPALEAQLTALVAERDALKQAYEALELKADTLAKGQQAADALQFDEAATRR